jgi:hypothetical protein
VSLVVSSQVLVLVAVNSVVATFASPHDAEALTLQRVTWENLGAPLRVNVTVEAIPKRRP